MKRRHAIRVGLRQSLGEFQEASGLFEEAKSVFFDDFALLSSDKEHSSVESWFILLGMSSGARLLLVCHCERGGGDVIRIFSARKATRNEASFYPGE